MRLFICIVISLLCFSPNIYAVKAISQAVTITQPDGSTLKVKVHGDEFFNYYTTEDGYTISKGKDGFFYYANYNSGKLVVSANKVSLGTKSGFGARGVPQHVIDYYQNKAQNELQSLFNSVRTKSSSLFPPKVLVILAQYSDVKFVTPNTKQAFHEMLNQNGYSTNGGTGSAADYFSDNSMEVYRPEFIVSDIVTLPKSYKYYGEKTPDENVTKNAQEQTKDACTEVVKTGINFSDFDSDNDGVVDIVLIYYAGYNAAEGTQDAVWPHRWAVNGNFMINGKRIFSYACTSELKGTLGERMTGIGTMCHEFCHTLGLPDLYDVNYSGAPALWGSLAIMDGGNYNNEGRTPPLLTSLERSLLGWLTPTEIKNSGTYSLENLDKNKAYLIKTDNEGEYYLLENRQSTGWDTYIKEGGMTVGGAAAPKGMMITHIDRSNNIVQGIAAKQKWNNNSINTVKSHQCANLVEACALENPARIPISDVLFPGTKNVTKFTSTSVPSNTPWSGNLLGKDITNISLSGDVVKFDVKVETLDINKVQFFGSIKDFKNSPMQNVKISLYESAAAQTSGNKTFSVIPVKRTDTKAAPAYEVSTTASGQFEFKNIEPKTYIIEVKISGYIDYSTSKQLVAGNQTLNITMLPVENSPLLSTLQWHNNDKLTAIGFGEGSPLYTAVLFEPSDLTVYKKHKINKVKIGCNSNATIEMTIKVGAETIITKTLTTSAPSDNIIFDLSNDNVIKDNSKSLAVQFKFSNYSLQQKAHYIDSSPAVDGKGNLVSENGTTWSSLKSLANIDGNFMVTVELAEYSADNDIVSNLKKDISQTKVYLTWDSKLDDNTKWDVRWKTASNTEYKKQIVSERSIVLQNLDKNQAYDIKIGAITNENIEPTQWRTLDIVTINLTSPYPAILFNEKSYKAGDKLLVDIINVTGQVEKTTFTINGTPVTDNVYTFEKAGIHTIIAEIKYTSGDTEKITRKINVITL